MPPVEIQYILLLHACKQLANILPSKSTQQNLSWLQFLTSRISSRISLHFRPTSKIQICILSTDTQKQKAGGPYFVKSLYLSLFCIVQKFLLNSFLVKKIGQTFRLLVKNNNVIVALDNSSTALTIVKNWWLACPANNAKECRKILWESIGW